jgi:hypothetical protein
MNIIIDGTRQAEMDMEIHHSTRIDTGDPGQVRIIQTDELLPKDKVIEIGLKEIQRTQEERRGHYDTTQLRSAELVYVMSKTAPDRLVLAWEVTDNQFAQVVINALDGSSMYWSL